MNCWKKSTPWMYVRRTRCLFIRDTFSVKSAETNISITRIKTNLDNMVSNYVRSWLEIPGTLKIATLSKCKYGLNFINASTRFTQCQFTFRKTLKNSNNENIKKRYKVTRKGTKIQPDSYISTCDAIKKIQAKTEIEIEKELATQCPRCEIDLEARMWRVQPGLVQSTR